MLQNEFRAVDIRLDRAHGVLHDELHADGGGEVVDDVGAVDQLHQELLVVQIVQVQVQPLVLTHGVQVPYGAGGQVVEDMHVLPGGQQPLRQVRTNKAGPAGDQCSGHVRLR